VPSEDAGQPFGFPEGFGRGPAEEDAVLLLRCLPGSTPRSLHAVIWAAGTASGAVRRIERGGAGSDNDRAFLGSADPKKIRARLASLGARFAQPGDPDYWPAFLRLADPPVGVFVRGRPLDPGDERVGVVGSRRPTPTGREVAVDLASGLASCGMVTVSGGAFGIDTAAHRGALDAGGATVAVLGSGIDQPHPRGNRRLFAEIESAGTLISEYPPGVPAEPFRFPARNRLIAALSRAVIVVEGATKSGARITAEHALELGLDVFAIPGSVTNPLAETPLELIREGATLIRGLDDLLHDLGVDPSRIGRGPAATGLSADECRVYQQLAGPTLPTTIARDAGLSRAAALSALIGLELRGLVRGRGGRFERTLAGRSRSASARRTSSNGSGRPPDG
jgi:DNA processing protein